MKHIHVSAENGLRKPARMFSVILALLMVAGPFTNQFLSAQDTQKPSETKAKVHLSEQEWKAVEGIFQSSVNKEMYVQFTAKDDALSAKLLWNNNEIHLLPESSLAFTSKEAGEEGPIHITFSKDSMGAVNQVNVANNGVWNRTKNYQPVIKKEMEHSPEQLKPFEGIYRFISDSSNYLQLTAKNNNLILKQLWDGREIPFVPETPLDFFTKDEPLFSLSFTKDNDGNITQLLAFKRDLWIKMRYVSLTMDQLKPYEGKYQSKDDPDNYIQIAARDNNLVVKQLWDGKEITVKPQTETYFYNDAQSFPLQIIKDKAGTVSQVVILGVDAFNKVK